MPFSGPAPPNPRIGNTLPPTFHRQRTNYSTDRRGLSPPNTSRWTLKLILARVRTWSPQAHFFPSTRWERGRQPSQNFKDLPKEESEDQTPQLFVGTAWVLAVEDSLASTGRNNRLRIRDWRVTTNKNRQRHVESQASAEANGAGLRWFGTSITYIFSDAEKLALKLSHGREKLSLESTLKNDDLLPIQPFLAKKP